MGVGLGGCSILQEWCKEEVRSYERMHELLLPCTQAVERLERIGRVNHFRMVAQSCRIKRATRCLSRDRSAFQIVRIHDMPRFGG